MGMTRPTNIAIGADHGGFELKGVLSEHLRAAGYQLTDVGTSSREAVDYPVFARAVAEAVSRGSADVGIMIDGAGIGSCMAANKVPGVRAALCTDAETARGARRWNDANVLAMGLRLTSPEVGREMLDVFLTTDADPDELAEIAKLG